MRQFKIEGKNKIITFLKRSKQKLFIHSRSQKVSLPNTLPRGFKHLAGAPQERPASSHQEWTRCFFLHNTSFQEAHTKLKTLEQVTQNWLTGIKIGVVTPKDKASEPNPLADHIWDKDEPYPRWLNATWTLSVRHYKINKWHKRVDWDNKWGRHTQRQGIRAKPSCRPRLK